MPTYDLRCECGAILKVEPRDAGRNLICEKCNASTEAPGLRELRSLPLAEEQPEEVPEWSSKQKMVFVAGLVLTLIAALISGIAGYNMYKLAPQSERPEYVHGPQFREHLEQVEPDELFDLFRNIEKQGVGDYTEPQYVAAEERFQLFTTILMIGLVVLVIGCVTMVSSVYIDRPK